MKPMIVARPIGAALSLRSCFVISISFSVVLMIRPVSVSSSVAKISATPKSPTATGRNLIPSASPSSPKVNRW